MTLGAQALLILFGLTALNWTIHWYTQTVTYSLFPEVARQTSGAAFVDYHRAYQKRLVWAIYLPWSLLMVASVAAMLLADGGLSVWGWSVAMLHAAIGAISVAFAAPIHRRIDDQGALTAADADALLRANLARLVVATLGLCVCFAWTVRTIAS